LIVWYYGDEPQKKQTNYFVINHLPLKVFMEFESGNNEMRFTLSRNEQAKLATEFLLSKPSFKQPKAQHWALV
jgi:hypothetical protein